MEGDGSNDERQSIKAWRNYLLRDKSVIVDIFQGQLRNTLTCKQCQHRSVKFDPFMYLSIPIPSSSSNGGGFLNRNNNKNNNNGSNGGSGGKNNPITLDDCLDLFCREELLTNENQWYCPKCEDHVDAIKKFDLWTLPPILIVHLKRFKHHTAGGGGIGGGGVGVGGITSWMSRGSRHGGNGRVTKISQR